MRAIIDLKYLLEEELEKIVRKGDITPTELERLDKAVDIIKDIETICAMKEYNYQEEEEGYSGGYPMYARDGRGGSYEGSYRRGGGGGGGNSRMGGYMMDPRYYRDGGSYDGSYEGGSYARGGRSYDDRSYEQGRGGSSRGYSGHASKEELKKDLEEMMGKAGSDKERMAIQQLLEQWKD